MAKSHHQSITTTTTTTATKDFLPADNGTNYLTASSSIKLIQNQIQMSKNQQSVLIILMENFLYKINDYTRFFIMACMKGTIISTNTRTIS
jgi:hypothetical protein